MKRKVIKEMRKKDGNKTSTLHLLQRQRAYSQSLELKQKRVRKLVGASVSLFVLVKQGERERGKERKQGEDMFLIRDRNSRAFSSSPHYCLQIGCQ